jgi:hypothetical protein
MAQDHARRWGPLDFLRAALTGGIMCSSSLQRRAAYNSMAPPGSTGNPGSVYINCEAGLG